MFEKKKLIHPLTFEDWADTIKLSDIDGLQEELIIPLLKYKTEQAERQRLTRNENVRKYRERQRLKKK
jgi:hypothetical protein